MVHSVCRAALAVAALVATTVCAAAQVRAIEPPIGPSLGNLGGLGSSGSVLSHMPSLDSRTSLPKINSAPTFSLPRVPELAVPQGQNQAPAAGDSETTVTAAPPAPVPEAPVSHPLMYASAYTAGNAQQCDISEAARETCDGPDCLLACAADTCGGEPNASCEFVLDCAAEITAELISGDQQCEDTSIETTDSSNGTVSLHIVRLDAGQSCKPPPCMK